LLRPPSFMTLWTRTVAAQVHEGRVYLPFADARLAIVAPEDVAAVAVAALTEPERHRSRGYSPTGPEGLTLAQMAAAVGTARGRPVEYVPVPDDAFVSAATGLGMPPEVARAYTGYARFVRSGGASQPTSDVENVTARPPRALEAWLRANAQ